MMVPIKMRKKSGSLFLLVLIISTDLTHGKSIMKNSVIEKYKNQKIQHKTNNKNDRNKRSLNDLYGTEIRTKSSALGNIFNSKYDNIEGSVMPLKNDKLEIEHPFWGTRGRRDDSSSMERNILNNGFSIDFNDDKYNPNCKHCLEPYHNAKSGSVGYIKEHGNDGFSPFWGNRGRRNSNEISSNNYLSSENLFENRDVKEENDPFWGTRGRRMDEVVYKKDLQEDDPFWGNRGRRDENDPFWGNRGRRDENDPFWGNRGRRDEIEPFWGNRGRRDENEPFWGNRGRREESEPFWGNRGRRQESDPFWGNRGRRDQTNTYNKDQEKHNIDLKHSILMAIREIQHDIENLSRLKRSNDDSGSFWDSRGRNSQIQTLFNGERYKVKSPNGAHGPKLVKGSSSSTVLDDRVFAEEPRYIIVERSSRSSAEDDPFFISRGKKKYHNIQLFKAARDRRGAIEELVKSVRNDPYYIARGKKDNTKIENSTILRANLGKAKELICATLDFISTKSGGGKVKRDITDNDRDRRTILKKLAAQLQIDPYFVSRGKKSGDFGVNDNELDIFINEISAKCH